MKEQSLLGKVPVDTPACAHTGVGSCNVPGMGSFNDAKQTLLAGCGRDLQGP